MSQIQYISHLPFNQHNHSVNCERKVKVNERTDTQTDGKIRVTTIFIMINILARMNKLGANAFYSKS